MIKGLSHMTFIVKDLEQATKFFKEIFDAQEVYSSGDRCFSISKEKFFLIGQLWIAIMEGESLPEKTYNHIAFFVDQADLDIYEERIKKLGLTFRVGRSRIEGEGKSIYFYDYDNHLFELHTGTLDERLRAYK